jgi:hypothetical protein
MDYNELLFAAEVRRQAVELRTKEWVAYSRAPETLEKNASSNVPGQGQRDWEADNPIEPYLLQAVRLIRDAAEFIHQLPPE